jgi:hypothetical protein
LDGVDEQILFYRSLEQTYLFALERDHSTRPLPSEELLRAGLERVRGTLADLEDLRKGQRMQEGAHLRNRPTDDSV